jgi:hypothetical protein
MSYLRPRQAGPQSAACFRALKLGANLRLSESQVMPSQSTAYRFAKFFIPNNRAWDFVRLKPLYQKGGRLLPDCPLSIQDRC